MKNIAIKVDHVTKIYKLYDEPIDRLKESLHPFKKQYHKEFYALKDITFEIKKGETVGIIGKNGAGKSTLLKIITGVLTPTYGNVHIHGRIASLLELGAGLNPECTGIENIYLLGTLMGYTHEQMQKRVDAIIEFADIGDFVYQPVRSYSSGMFARLAFSIHINVEPDILIVDEALSVGDMNFQAKCMTAMDRLRQAGTTILFVSHDIGSVKSLCERGIYLKEGALHAIGKASEIAELYIREMRENLNVEYKKFTRISQPFAYEKSSSTLAKLDENLFKTSEEFSKRVAQFRYGSGGVKVTFVELLSHDYEPLIDVEFNQEVIIRIYLESEIEEDVSVNFQIFDDKAINLVACNFRQVGQELLSLMQGDRVMVDYQLKLPLQDNSYSIRIIVNTPILENQPAHVLDIVPNSYIFRMRERPLARLWSKIDLFPRLTIKKV